MTHAEQGKPEPPTDNPQNSVTLSPCHPVTLSASFWIACLLLTAALLIHLPRLISTHLSWDDFQILTESWPWEVTQANLWFAANEHAMPAGRLTTFVLVEVTPLRYLPWVAAAQGPVAVLIGMVLVYFFAARERGHPAYGLLAMALFGVTSQYHEAVSWFAASFSILALDSLLLALLAAQAWRQTGKVLYLPLAALACALAPCWFAVGILAGPLCALYLALPQAPGPRIEWRWPAWTPLLGTALFLSFSIPLTSRQIMALEHYGDKTATQSFDLVGGVLCTLRALTDNVVLGNLGLPAFPLPAHWTYALALVWFALFAWWWWRSPHKGLTLLGLAFIVTSLLLTYGARVRWGADGILQWSRYNLFAQMGFALIVVGGLPDRKDWESAWWRLEGTKWIVAAIVLLTLVQFPRAWPRSLTAHEVKDRLRADPSPAAIVGLFRHSWNEELKTQTSQQKDLAEIEEVDRRCREHRISAAQARDALPEKIIAQSSPKANGWKFLRGCDDCAPHDPDEVRRLLEPAPDTPEPNR